MLRLLAAILTLWLYSGSVAHSAPQPLYGWAKTGIFKILHDITNAEGKPDIAYGTAFCLPGHTNTLMTAAHATGQGEVIIDYYGKVHPIEVNLSVNTKTDIALIQMVDPVCELNGFEFAAKNAEPGTHVSLLGYGAGLDKQLLTEGIISGEVGILKSQPTTQPAQLNGLGGHSGSPVFDDQNRIVGMLVGGFAVKDEMDFIIPVEALRKSLK